jgi:hypothetical protein
MQEETAVHPLGEPSQSSRSSHNDETTLADYFSYTRPIPLLQDYNIHSLLDRWPCKEVVAIRELLVPPSSGALRVDTS